ncbi:ABC transporter permease [Sediminicola luteus]|uniref:ABC transporter permease n=1 Tax=Sediminicola luteus TaxID=319238 RepID=A0A2A4G8K5_9FLAO|nr:ABC transporter permease [Sediminicola luteus]PCE64304.1 ABC transporter permease [Sediminicola luteus]
MSKLGLIIKREYMAKVRNRSFVVMTFLSPLLMVGMIVLIAYLAKVNEGEQRVITILNESGYFEGDFNNTEALSYIVLDQMDLETAKDSTLNLDYYGLLYIPNRNGDMEESAAQAYFYTRESPNTGVLTGLEAKFQKRLRLGRLQKLGVSEGDFEHIEADFELQTESFSGHQNLKGINEIKAIIGGMFGYLIMMFIIIYGSFVMRSVIEEKTSRIIEVIISSVKPFQLMMGKIIGTSMAGITQFVIWVVSGGVLLFASSLIFGFDLMELQGGAGMASQAMELQGMEGFDEKIMLYGAEIWQLPWALMLISFIIYFVLGYFIYSSIYAAIGAAVDNETDTQQFMLPVILPLMLAIYIGFFSVFSNPHGPIAVIFSLIPLTSPIVMLMRLPAGLGEGGVAYWEFFTSIFLLLASFLAIVWLAAKIYRVGILMYGKKPSYRELYKWLRY